MLIENLSLRIWLIGLRRVIACLGCVVTILSLTYSTFTQQLISLEMLPAGNETFLASIPQGETWNRWHYTGAWDEGGQYLKPLSDQRKTADDPQTCSLSWKW